MWHQQCLHAQRRLKRAAGCSIQITRHNLVTEYENTKLYYCCHHIHHRMPLLVSVLLPWRIQMSQCIQRSICCPILWILLLRRFNMAVWIILRWNTLLGFFQPLADRNLLTGRLYTTKWSSSNNRTSPCSTKYGKISNKLWRVLSWAWIRYELHIQLWWWKEWYKHALPQRNGLY